MNLRAAGTRRRITRAAFCETNPVAPAHGAIETAQGVENRADSI
jgi:hypothetical protein